LKKLFKKGKRFIEKHPGLMKCNSSAKNKNNLVCVLQAIRQAQLKSARRPSRLYFISFFATTFAKKYMNLSKSDK